MKQMIEKVINSIWAKFDKDKNGELDRNEARKFITATIAEMGTRETVTTDAFNTMFEEMDVNGNGRVDKEEMAIQIKKFLNLAIH